MACSQAGKQRWLLQRGCAGEGGRACMGFPAGIRVWQREQRVLPCEAKRLNALLLASPDDMAWGQRVATSTEAGLQQFK